MEPDLRSLFQRSAPSPTRRLDARSLLQQGARRRRSRYLYLSAAAVVLLLIAGLSANALLRGRGRLDPVSHDQAPAPRCGRTEITSDEYGTEIHPSRGRAGTEVTLSGTTLRGEDGRWAPSDRLEAWWNTDTPSSAGSEARPVRDGPVVKLVVVDDMERCGFATTFTVPEAEPGRYKISVFVWDAEPDEGYGLFLPHHFRVIGD